MNMEYKKKPCNVDGCGAPVPKFNVNGAVWRYGKCISCRNKQKAATQRIYDSSDSRKKARRIKAGREVDDIDNTDEARRGQHGDRGRRYRLVNGELISVGVHL